MAWKKGRLIIEGSNSMEEEDWDFLTEDLTEMMMKKNPNGKWVARVENFGWRSLSGHKEVFEAKTGMELLRAILPDTECSFRIYHYGRNGIAINNAHHDSPMWAEWYFITKATRKDEGDEGEE